MNAEKNIAVVVLAAGQSKRMGRPKQLLEVGGQTLIRRAVSIAVASDSSFVVVAMGQNHLELRAELGDLTYEVALVEKPELGQSESIRAGLEVAAKKGCDAVLFMPCDMPLLTAEHLSVLMVQYRKGLGLIAASRYDGILGIPMLLDSALWDELRELRGDVGARKIVGRHEAKTTFVEWEGGQFDIDTPQDYENFRQTKDVTPARKKQDNNSISSQ